MHGKIIRYQEFSGKGVVINHFKKLFSFNRSSWHDQKALPTKGLLVECRVDNDNILDARASRYQVFNESTIVTEHDFWITQTDEELAEIEEKKRFIQIQKIYRETDYTKMEDIPITIPIIHAIKNYFVLENAAISMVDDLPQHHEFLLNYLLLKRFLLKALDTLLFIDRTRTRDYFLRFISPITRLENSYRSLMRCKNINPVPIFEAYFLRYQSHYQALCAAITNSQEGLSLLERQKQGAVREIKYIQKQFGNNLTAELNKKIDELNQSLDKHERNLSSTSEHIKHLKALRDEFYQRNLDTFQLVLETTHTRLLRRLKVGLNICSTLLDDEIWKLAINSSSLKAQFFRNGGEENICTYTFAKFYLSHLDRGLLHGIEQEVYNYCQKIRKNLQNYILIVSDSIDFTTNVKIEILSQNKYNNIKSAPKVIALHSLLRDIAFTQIVIDQNITWLSTDDVISTIHEFPKNKNTDIKIISRSDTLKQLSNQPRNYSNTKLQTHEQALGALQTAIDSLDLMLDAESSEHEHILSKELSLPLALQTPPDVNNKT